MSSTHDWRPVTKASPCIVCEKPDWCAITADAELVHCMRCADAPQGYRFIRTSKNGGHLFGLVDN